MMSINLFAPLLRLARGFPTMLPERSRISTMSAGLLVMSGSAVSDSLTSKVPPQSMRAVLKVLLELVTPNGTYPFLSPVLFGGSLHYTHQARSLVPHLPLRRCPGRKGKDRNPGQRRAQQVQQEHKEPIFLISPQAIFSPALPDGCVVKSSGFKWTITVFPRTSRTENRSVRKTAKAKP